MIPTLMQGGLGRGAQSIYWNPADTDSKIVLSASNRVATRSSTSSSTWCSTRSVVSRNAGKFYAECVNTTSAIAAMMFGVGTSAAVLTSFPGAGTTSWGIHCNAGSVQTYHNSSATSPGIPIISGGGYARIAVDLDAGKLWIGLSSSATWAGGGDPAAGTSPTYSFTPGTTLHIMLGLYVTGQVCTLRTKTGQNAGTIPVGYSMWG